MPNPRPGRHIRPPRAAVPASARPDTTLRRRPGRRDAGAAGGACPRIR